MTTYISGSPAFWIAVLVAIPLLTMRLLAEERRSGTIETLLTLPVTETEVVLAKWLAGVVMYLVLLVPFALYLPFLYYQAHFDFDLGPVLRPGDRPDDDGDDVRGDRAVLQLDDAQPDHRGDLDVRVAAVPDRGGPAGVPVRGAAARRLGRGRPVLSVLYQIRSFGWASSTCAPGAAPFGLRAVLCLTVKVLEARANR